MRTFTNGVNDDFGTFIRSRNLNSLEAYLTMIKEELDIRYSQAQNSKLSSNLNQRRSINFSPNNFKQITNNSFRTAYPLRQLQPFIQPQLSAQSFVPRQFNPNFNRQNNPTSHQHRNVFAPKQNYRPTNKPIPMEANTIVKRPPTTQLTNHNKFRANSQNIRTLPTPAGPQRTFISEELFYHDDDEPETSTYPQYDYQDSITRSEQFPEQYLEQSTEEEISTEELENSYYQYSNNDNEDAENFH